MLTVTLTLGVNRPYIDAFSQRRLCRWFGKVTQIDVAKASLPWIRTLNHCLDPPSKPGFHDNVMVLYVWLTNVTSKGGSGRPEKKHVSIPMQRWI